jgi:DNA-binding beta-propeller fold protein YncE
VVRKALGAAVTLATVLAFAAQAGADIVYWGNQSPNRISFAALDGSSSGDLNTSGAVVTTPDGTALDPAHGRIYWANGNGKISFANLDGSGGGGTLNTAGATITDPVGLALDPIAGRVYWANEEDDFNAIGYANLDGSGGGNLNTAGATLDEPTGVAVDAAAGLIYWTNDSPSRAGVSFARLNGSGGGDLTLFSSTGSATGAVAVDPLNQRAWWTNQKGSKVEFIGLNGSGRGSLTTSATVASPIGLALDPSAQRVYWANASTLANTIAFANFDGSSPGSVNAGTATVSVPVFPVLLKPPVGTGPPSVGGGSTAKSKLTCSGVGWAGDLSPAHLYQAPQNFAYAWTRNGRRVKGAKTDTLRADGAGRYRCAVTASNQAGSTTQTSQALTVPRRHRR